MLSHPNIGRFHYFNSLRAGSGSGVFILAMTAMLLLTAALDQGVSAQGTTSGGFKGLVRDRATGAPIAGATVVLRNTDVGTQAVAITDANGTYLKTSLPPGPYDIRVSSTGYVTQTQQQVLFTMANYWVEPNPFDLVAEGAVTSPTPTVPDDPTDADVGPAPAAVGPARQGMEGESLSLDPRRFGIFDRRSVTGLPLGSNTLTRTFDELAFLVPGVNPPPQAIGNSVGPGVGGGVGTSGQFSINGLRSRANNFTIDGSDNNDEDIGVRRQGFFTLVPQPIESIQEFQITTLLAPAEFGRNLGAQVNAVSRSGSNGVHGSLFFFANSERLNARNFFDNASGNRVTDLTSDGTPTGIPVMVDGGQRRVSYTAGDEDEFTLFQGGFAVGGPIVRNKAFFFLSGEAQELDGTRERNFAVPTVAQRGLFGSGATGLMTGDGDPVFPTSIAGDEVFSLFPFANNPTGVYGGNTYTRALSTDAKGRIFSGRVDWNIFKINQNQQTFTARYNYSGDERDLTDVGGAIFSAIRPISRTDNISTFLSGAWTNSITNEFRFSYGRTRLRFDELPDDSGFLSPVTGFSSSTDTRFLLSAPVLFNNTLPGTPAQYGSAGFTTGSLRPFGLGPIGQVLIAGFSPIGVDVFNFPQDRENATYQIADTLRWQVGKHSIAFGTDIRRITLDSDLPRNSRPLVTFNGGRRCLNADCSSVGLASPLDLAASGATTGFFQSLILPGETSEISLKYNQLNFFAQDEWRVNRRVVVSFGLRYDYNTVPIEADGKIESALGQSLPPRVAAFSNFINGRTKIFDADRNNFAPRLGFAAGIDDKTVIRGGFGIYYDQILGAVVSQSRNLFPRFTTINFGGGNLPFCVGEVCVLQFSLFNPLNGNIGGTPIIAPGTLNTLNPAFVTGSIPSGTFLDTIFGSFPFLNGTPFGGTYPTRTLETPNSFQYSIGLEREVYRNTFLSAAYVGTKGRNLLRFTTPNLGPNYLAFVLGFFAENNQPVVLGTTGDPDRPIPAIGPISQFESTGRSQYNSLQLGLRGRWRNSFQYQMNYVYGSVKDDVSDVFDLAGGFALPQNSSNFAGEYAPANFDVRHRFTYNFLYSLPRLNSYSGIVRNLFGNWELAGTGKFNTGQPFTVNSIYDVNLDGNLTDRLNNTQGIRLTGDRQRPLTLSSADTSSMLAAFGSDGSVPRNSFRAGNLLDLDLTISRRFHITEGHDLQFRVDIFNFINRDNFGVPVRFLEAPGFGSAVDTITPGRRVQFGLKYNF